MQSVAKSNPTKEHCVTKKYRKIPNYCKLKNKMSFWQGEFFLLMVSSAILIISICLIINFCLFLKHKLNSDTIIKIDILTEDTKMSQTAQYEGARPSKVDYPVAVSNRLFKDSEIIKDLPCQYCNMIAMGEMACYEEFCPECGRIEPNRKRPQHWFEYLNTKKSVTFEEV